MCGRTKYTLPGGIQPQVRQDGEGRRPRAGFQATEPDATQCNTA